MRGPEHWLFNGTTVSIGANPPYMIYRFTIEVDIQADAIEGWDAEAIARDYLRQTIEESPLHDHVLEWQIKHLSAYPEPTPTATPQSEPVRTWHTQQLYQSPQGATPPANPNASLKGQKSDR
jgi:hypothetical protein